MFEFVDKKITILAFLFFGSEVLCTEGCVPFRRARILPKNTPQLLCRLHNPALPPAIVQIAQFRLSKFVDSVNDFFKKNALQKNFTMLY